MRMGPIILVAGTLGVVALVAPGLKVEDGAGKSAHAAASASASPGAREEWLSGGTAIERESDGHFYADADVDSRSTRFLVDTGATIVALTGEDAAAIGLTWDEADLVTVGRGASGDVKGVPVRLDRVELGGFEARGVEAAIVPDGLDVSLLGQSFLSRLGGVRIEGDRMMLGDS